MGVNIIMLHQIYEKVLFAFEFTVINSINVSQLITENKVAKQKFNLEYINMTRALITFSLT